ncbi:MAG: peptidoglycan DD-metalloendopeptidase family protein [Actinobacteria bacterium]|nr:peptidoglycan DD-metalloendopeptidase family protein [Actinomycetota bacterium]
MSAGRRCRAALAGLVLAVIVPGPLVGPVGPAAAQDGAGSAADAGVRPRYRPPVDAQVSDPFRAPTEPWAPGNRGIEYATTPGQMVRAIGPGVVTFAGPVAGALHVTVRHPDGLRSSYSFVAAVRVGAGDVVDAGAVVAVAGERFHLGVRRGETYLDPSTLWGGAVGGGRAHLVPDPGPDGGGTDPIGPGPDPTGVAGATFGQVARSILATVGPW